MHGWFESIVCRGIWISLPTSLPWLLRRINVLTSHWSWRINVLTSHLTWIVISLTSVHCALLIHLRRMRRIVDWGCHWHVIRVCDGHDRLNSSCSLFLFFSLEVENSSEDCDTHRYTNQDYEPGLHFTDKTNTTWQKVKGWNERDKLFSVSFNNVVVD